MAGSSSLNADVEIEYSDDPDAVLTNNEREELCEYWDCEEHFHGDDECPIKKTEKKVLEIAKQEL